MDVDGEEGMHSKRKPQDDTAADAGWSRQPHGSSAAADPACEQPTASGTSSDKRQKLAAAAAAAGAAAPDDVSSSLLPLHPLTSEAAERLQRLGSPELEVEDETATLEAMLAAPPPPADAAQREQGSAGAGGGEWGHGDASGQPGSPTLLASQLSDLHLEGGLAGSTVDSTPMDADAEAELPAVAGAASPSPGSPQAAATAAASQQLALRGQQQEADRAEEERRGLGGGGGDPLISHLAAADAAAPIQMLSLDALDRNPLLHQFQQQRLQAVRAEQMARAVAAAAVLHGQLSGREAMEEVEDDEEVTLT